MGGSFGSPGKVWEAPLGAHRDGLPVGMRSLRSRGDTNRQPQATRPSRCLYWQGNIDVRRSTQGGLVSPSIGLVLSGEAMCGGSGAPPELLASGALDTKYYF